MSLVDPEFARWLREGWSYASASDAQVATIWAAIARETTINSPLALAAGAEAEAQRQLAFLRAPLAIEQHLVPGLHHQLIGQPVTITVDQLGYDAGIIVFVIGVEELSGAELTRLTVLRKLTDPAPYLGFTLALDFVAAHYRSETA